MEVLYQLSYYGTNPPEADLFRLFVQLVRFALFAELFEFKTCLDRLFVLGRVVHHALA
jgi:hypothetical protein